MIQASRQSIFTDIPIVSRVGSAKEPVHSFGSINMAAVRFLLLWMVSKCKVLSKQAVVVDSDINP